jgi:riboflavin synthase alpha subunit
MTFFEKLKVGDSVNLEFDILGKYIERLLKKSEKKQITMEWLSENGF